MKHRTGHLFLRGSSYYLQYVVEGKRVVRALGIRDKDKAEAEREKIMAPYRVADKVEALQAVAIRLDAAKAEATRLTDEAHPPLSILAAWRAYVESETRPQSGARTLGDYESHWNIFSAWLAEHKPSASSLREIAAEDAAAFVRAMAKRGLSGNRINKFARFLKTFFRVLAKPAKLAGNPFQDIARRPQLPESKRPLTIEELKTVIETAEGEMKTLFMLGTFSGLRLGDAANLQWGEVDLTRAIIRRVPRKTARTGKAVVLGIPPILGSHLAALPRQGPCLMPQMAAMYDRCEPQLSRNIQAHLEKCGIPTLKPGTGPGTKKRAVVIAGYHSLRHSFVSMHAQAGTPQAVLMKSVGHGSPMMTDKYVSISEATARQTALALPAVLGPAPALPARDPLPEWAAKELRGIVKLGTAAAMRRALNALIE